VAWQTPEYSHGPLIPVLSALLFLRELKQYPPQPGPKNDRWIGVAVVLFSILVAVLGKLSNISDLVAYATIIWVAGILLISFGWQTGKHFWPPVLHLVYMLPLPGTIYYKVSTALQFISSELGVWFLHLSGVPVYLDGNIIDLGVLKLHVAEACSGLRYLFPILSFSYIFAVLYQGPKWHKAVLLLSAVPIAILMNSVRIALAGIIVQLYGLEWVEGFSHFFEGWVIFICSIVILFGLARLMLLLHPGRPSLTEVLDLDTTKLVPQMQRLQYVRPSAALIAAAVITLASLGAFQAVPERGAQPPARESFVLFPHKLGDWTQRGARQRLTPQVEATLGADDYLQISLAKPGAAQEVGLFIAWYNDQSDGGVHSPEICLPGAQRSHPDHGDRHAFPDQSCDHPEGRDANDGLLLVPAEGSPYRLGFRREILADDRWGADRTNRWRIGAPDDTDRPDRVRCHSRRPADGGSAGAPDPAAALCAHRGRGLTDRGIPRRCPGAFAKTGRWPRFAFPRAGAPCGLCESRRGDVCRGLICLRGPLNLGGCDR
jgi:exosortase D (VPLPA-CTERM-specific)